MAMTLQTHGETRIQYLALGLNERMPVISSYITRYCTKTRARNLSMATNAMLK